MTDEPRPPAADDCWNTIGVRGDRSCPELERHVHCRNCPVHVAAARAFFDRPAPPGYLAECASTLARPAEVHEEFTHSLLILRIAQEWIALRTRVVVEVARTRPIHRVPHRSDETLLGLVHLRGRLQLVVSLERLLDASPGDAGPATADDPRARLVVVRQDAETWTFPAAEVAGVHRFGRDRLQAVPSTLANPLHSFSQALIPWQDRSVGFLDDQRLFAALRGLSS